MLVPQRVPLSAQHTRIRILSEPFGFPTLAN
jgi:hypothetical protein